MFFLNQANDVKSVKYYLLTIFLEARHNCIGHQSQISISLRKYYSMCFLTWYSQQLRFHPQNMPIYELLQALSLHKAIFLRQKEKAKKKRTQKTSAGLPFFIIHKKNQLIKFTTSKELV